MIRKPINEGLQQNVSKKESRLINEQTIKYFQSMLKDETWDTVYESTCINETFSRFQDIFLRYYEASFPVFYTNYRSNHNNWITKGIKISCAKKRESSVPYIEIIKIIFR